MVLVSPALRKICDTSADYVEATYQDFVVAEERDQLMGAMQELRYKSPTNEYRDCDRAAATEL